tara:strand:+ start:482 stop:1078 length:597 start_codon:yes stop_codon:yes gene_type:complete
MKYYDISVDHHPLREGVRDNTNHYLTGRDGGRDIDLRRFATEGMELFGLLTGLEDSTLQFAPDLTGKLDAADAVYERINRSIDKYIEENGIDAPTGTPYQPEWQPEAEREQLDLRTTGITSIVWCIGFSPDFRYVEASVFDGHGQPVHQRGVSAQCGLYFLGPPWLHTWGSGRFSGIAQDAEYLAEQIVRTAHLQRTG